MDREQLFIHTIQDIKERLASTDSYEILMIAALLRKLLLDAFPLVDQVNKSRRIKIKFIINNRPVPSDHHVDFWSIEDGLDPETSRFQNPKEVNKDQLLGTAVLKIEEKTFTIKHVILHLAHIEGAVHAGKTKDEKDKILEKVVKEMNIGGLPASLRLLKAIARVILKGLQSLEMAIVQG